MASIECDALNNNMKQQKDNSTSLSDSLKNVSLMKKTVYIQTDGSQEKLTIPLSAPLIQSINSKEKSSAESVTLSVEDEGSKESNHGLLDDCQLDNIIDQLMSAPLGKTIVHKKKGLLSILSPSDKESPLVDVFIQPQLIRQLTLSAIQMFKKEPMLLRLKIDSPFHIFGDSHGQFRDVRMMINHIGLPDSGKSFLFLGDYVDRGLQGVESYMLLLALRCRYPNNFHLLRGNHEDVNTSQTYGFYDEVMMKYGNNGERVFSHLLSCFNYMPVCALLNGKILAMHGGISPHIEQLSDIDKILRPTIIPPYGLMCDLLWADPDTVIEHKMNEFGMKWFSDGRLITIFSAPNYLNMGNDGCVLQVNSDLNLRALIGRIEELKEDLDHQSKARIRAEHQRRELQEQLDHVSQEVAEASGQLDAQIHLNSTRATELSMLHRELEKKSLNQEAYMADLCSMQYLTISQLRNLSQQAACIEREAAQIMDIRKSQTLGLFKGPNRINVYDENGDEL